MYKIPFNIYFHLANALMERIKSHSLFTGVIELIDNDIEFRFIVTLIPYFCIYDQNESSVPYLANIVPVWWELHTITPEGEVINDFDFEILKDMVCR